MTRHRSVQPMDLPKLRKSSLRITGENISVRTPRLCDCLALDHLLCTDAELIRLGIGANDVPSQTGKSFRDATEAWCVRTNSVSLAVVDRNDRAFGLISLSHIDDSERTGGIGYWIGSDYWGQGYGTESFALVLSLARKLGITSVSATINKNNTPSIRLWSHHNATIADLPGDRVRCTINLESSSSM